MLKTLKKEISLSLQALKGLENIITIFGGARVNYKHIAYANVQELAYTLAACQYSIMTGGGPGIMEAANRGLMLYKEEFKSDSIFSIGLNIHLPHEQKLNPYVEIALKFQNFSGRKFIFNHKSIAFIVAAGGFGTLDELSEVLVQVSTHKLRKIPIILYGKDYWKGFLEWLQNTLLEQNTISQEQLALLKIADTPKEVLKILEDSKTLDSSCHTS